MASEDLVVGLGETFYRVHRPWGRLPGGVEIELPSQLAVDRHGCVYLFQRSGIPVIVLDPDGHYLRSWGVGSLIDPHGIFASPDDRIFCVDRDAHQIIVYDLEGHELFRLGQRHRPSFGGPFNHPTDVATGPDGRIYVTDGYGNSRVHRFSRDGRFELSWGSPGSGPGEFMTPHGVWVLDDGRVLASDRENDRIQVFTEDGLLLASWPGFYHPMDVVADDAGQIYVSDQIPRLSRLDGQGRLTGRCRPVLNGGHGIDLDGHGNIFMAEMRPPQITKLERLA